MNTLEINFLKGTQGNSLAVQQLGLHRFQCLGHGLNRLFTGDLRSCKLHGVAQKEKKDLNIKYFPTTQV